MTESYIDFPTKLRSTRGDGKLVDGSAIDGSIPVSNVADIATRINRLAASTQLNTARTADPPVSIYRVHHAANTPIDVSAHQVYDENGTQINSLSNNDIIVWDNNDGRWERIYTQPDIPENYTDLGDTQNTLIGNQLLEVNAGGTGITSRALELILGDYAPDPDETADVDAANDFLSELFSTIPITTTVQAEIRTGIGAAAAGEGGGGDVDFTADLAEPDRPILLIAQETDDHTEITFDTLSSDTYSSSSPPSELTTIRFYGDSHVVAFRHKYDFILPAALTNAPVNMTIAGTVYDLENISGQTYRTREAVAAADRVTAINQVVRINIELSNASYLLSDIESERTLDQDTAREWLEADYDVAELSSPSGQDRVLAQQRTGGREDATLTLSDAFASLQNFSVFEIPAYQTQTRGSIDVDDADDNLGALFYYFSSHATPSLRRNARLAIREEFALNNTPVKLLYKTTAGASFSEVNLTRVSLNNGYFLYDSTSQILDGNHQPTLIINIELADGEYLFFPHVQTVGRLSREDLVDRVWPDADGDFRAVAQADIDDGKTAIIGRNFRIATTHTTGVDNDLAVSYRDFATSDLPSGHAYRGAHSGFSTVNSPQVNDVVYNTYWQHFYRWSGTQGWVSYGFPSRWRGQFASKSDADEHVQGTNDVVEYGDKVRVVTSYTPATESHTTRVWGPTQDILDLENRAVDNLPNSISDNDGTEHFLRRRGSGSDSSPYRYEFIDSSLLPGSSYSDVLSGNVDITTNNDFASDANTPDGTVPATDEWGYIGFGHVAGSNVTGDDAFRRFRWQDLRNVAAADYGGDVVDNGSNKNCLVFYSTEQDYEIYIGRTSTNEILCGSDAATSANPMPLRIYSESAAGAGGVGGTVGGSTSYVTGVLYMNTTSTTAPTVRPLASSWNAATDVFATLNGWLVARPAIGTGETQWVLPYRVEERGDGTNLATFGEPAPWTTSTQYSQVPDPEASEITTTQPTNEPYYARWRRIDGDYTNWIRIGAVTREEWFQIFYQSGNIGGGTVREVTVTTPFNMFDITHLSVRPYRWGTVPVFRNFGDDRLGNRSILQRSSVNTYANAYAVSFICGRQKAMTLVQHTDQIVREDTDEVTGFFIFNAETDVASEVTNDTLVHHMNYQIADDYDGGFALWGKREITE